MFYLNIFEIFTLYTDKFHSMSYIWLLWWLEFWKKKLYIIKSISWLQPSAKLPPDMTCTSFGLFQLSWVTARCTYWMLLLFTFFSTPKNNQIIFCFYNAFLWPYWQLLGVKLHNVGYPERKRRKASKITEKLS